MTSKHRANMKRRAKVIKALAHPSRLAMVERLSREACCVNELTDMVRADMSTISKHLAILKDAGIVESKKNGLQVCYRLKMECVRKFLECVDAMEAEHMRKRKKS